MKIDTTYATAFGGILEPIPRGVCYRFQMIPWDNCPTSIFWRRMPFVQAGIDVPAANDADRFAKTVGCARVQSDLTLPSVAGPGIARPQSTLAVAGDFRIPPLAITDAVQSSDNGTEPRAKDAHQGVDAE